MYIGGEINLTQFNEEIVESDLVRELSKSPNPQRALEQLRDTLLHIQTQLRKYDPSITLLPEKSSPDKLFNDVVEAYSTLQAVDIIHRADRLPLTARAKSIINHALAYSDLARATRTMGEAWASFANSEQGKSYLETTGKTLTDLLDSAGIQLSSHYSDLRTAEADRIDVAASKNFARDAAAERSELDAAAAEADAAADTRISADLPSTEIPAEDSLTGEPLTIDPRETADNDPTDSTYTPPADSTPATDEAFDSITAKSHFGTTTGMMQPRKLTPHPAVKTRSKAPKNAKYNPNAESIVALRMPDGQHLIVSGTTRHQIALADPTCQSVKTTLIDYDPDIHTDDWVQTYNTRHRILHGTATTQDFATFFTLNPITHAAAIEQGLVPIDPKTGKPTAAYTKGRQLAVFKDGKYSHASGQEPDVLTGEVPVNLITHSDEVPQFKTNKAGNKSKQDGVVYALPGEYRTHDPFHIWQRKDGTLVIISGRHRLAKAIEAAASHIPATVYPETDLRDAQWARIHDFEQNVLDNQASVADTALYVRGQNPKGRPLTEEETKQFTRPGTNSEYGSFIGLHGSDSLIEYLSRGAITPEYAYQIAQLAPDDADTQQQAIVELVFNGKGIREAKDAATIFRQQRDSKTNYGELGIMPEKEKDFMHFVATRAAARRAAIGRQKAVHRPAKSDKSVQKHAEAGIKFEDVSANRAKLAELEAEQAKWSNPSLHPELMAELKAEFDQTAEGAQNYFDFGSFSIFSPSERSGLSALRKLTTTGKEAKFRSDTLNQNVMLLPGSAGKLKNPENPESKIVGAYGFIHMIAGRMAHGEDLNEATYTAVKAIMAAVNGKIEEETSSENKKEITLDGYNTWVYLKWQKEDKAWVVTGYKANDKHTSADDKRRAMNLAGSYALETFGGLQQVGAALDYAIARLAREYKQNNADPKRKPIPSQQETLVSSSQFLATPEPSGGGTFSLSRDPEKNRSTILSDREQTLTRVANFIKREANRTARVLGADTDKRRGGVHFAQGQAIIHALDKYIFSQGIIHRRTAAYRQLIALRNYMSEYIAIGQKGKLPANRKSKSGATTLKAAIRELLSGNIDTELASIVESIEASGAHISAEQRKNLHAQLTSRFAAESSADVLAAMMQTMGDIIETHLRDNLLHRMESNLRKLQPKLTPSRRLRKNIVDTETQRKLTLALRFLTMDARGRHQVRQRPAFTTSSPIKKNGHRTECPLFWIKAKSSRLNNRASADNH